MPPKVLVGTVTYEGKDYIIDRNKQAVANFDYPNYKHVYVDNSEGFDYFRKLKRRGYNNLYKVPRGKNSMEAIANSYTKLFELARKGDYDYLLTVEVDLLPKPDTIWRLLRSDTKVTGSWYWLERKNSDVKIPCIFTDREVKPGVYHTILLGGDVSNGESILDMSIIRDWINTGLRQCKGCGFGCTLIHKDIIHGFDEIGYISFEDSDKKPKHSDSWFYYQLAENEIPVNVDTDRQVYHEPSEWELVTDWW